MADLGSSNSYNVQTVHTHNCRDSIGTGFLAEFLALASFSILSTWRLPMSFALRHDSMRSDKEACMSECTHECRRAGNLFTCFTRSSTVQELTEAGDYVGS